MNAEDIAKLLEPVAETFGVAVKELWNIFVRQRVVDGISQLFVAIVIGFIPHLLNMTNLIGQVLTYAVALIFAYSAIPLIFNPGYEALQEVYRLAKGK